VDVSRHLLYWATMDGAETRRRDARGAGRVRRALERATGRGEGEHAPALLDCERCAQPAYPAVVGARRRAVRGVPPRARRLRAM
jgi:hypothetical protein